MIIDLSGYIGIGLLLLRLIVAIVFFESGRRHLKDPKGRAKSMEISVGMTIFLGIVEIVCSVGLVLGIFIQIAALGLILVMIGAIGKKIFVWKSGFWGKDGYGWHYDLMLLLMNLVILLTSGGSLVLLS